MYILEAAVRYREKLENLIGQYGIRSETPTHRVDDDGAVWRGNRVAVFHSTSSTVVELDRLKNHPVDTPVVPIKTIEDAKQFALEKSRNVWIEQSQPFRSWEEIIQKLAGEKSTYDVVQVVAQIWQELRLPASWFYLTAKGKILDEVHYDISRGFTRDFDKIEGERTSKGIGIHIGNYEYRDLKSTSSIEKSRFVRR
ncbi:MAG TPA: hypothetical protein VLH19_00705 [Patescibacteria group bacterium]|nr:hypothetical protein [Patescibacteria group bacterium]